jgi:hypothetical protein
LSVGIVTRSLGQDENARAARVSAERNRVTRLYVHVAKRGLARLKDFGRGAAKLGSGHLEKLAVRTQRPGINEQS